MKYLIFVFLTVSVNSNSLASICTEYLSIPSDPQKSFYFPNSTYTALNFANNQVNAADYELDTSVNNVLSYLNKVTSSLGRTFGGVKTVLYPASGSDAITAFRSFESATTVIGLDSNPFISDDKNDISFLTKPKNRLNYDVWTDVTRADRKYITDNSYVPIHGSILEIVITDLKAHYPDLVIHEVIRVNTRPAGHGIDNETATNGIVRFSEEPGSPIREYIHVHLPLVERAAAHDNKPEFLFLIDLILDYGFQGLISKAAMGGIFYKPTTEEDLIRNKEMFPRYPDFANPDRLNSPETPGFRAIRHISFNGGIMIDGDGVGRVPSEVLDANFVSLSISPERTGNEWIYTGTGGVSKKEYGYYKYKFGYSGEKIEVLLYTPQID